MRQRIGHLAARSRVGHVRLGLRLTGRQNGDKPADSQTDDQPAAGPDTVQLAPDQATTAAGEAPPDDTLTVGGPALSHEEYPPAAVVPWSGAS